MKSRGIKGSSIAEFAPVFFVLMLVVFLPMVDLLSVTMKYCIAWVYNFYECRELAMQPLNPSGGLTLTQEYTNVHNQQLKNWQTTGWYQFLGDNSFDSGWTAPTPSKDATLGVSFITDATTVNASPLVLVPFIGPVPGLGAPVPFTINSTRQCEYN